MLPWEDNIGTSPLKSGVKWPVYKRRDTQSAKSRQVWIARHLPPAGALKRNASKTQGYKPSYAQQQARVRRWCDFRPERDALLPDKVLSRLCRGWSPEQVAGRFALEAVQPVISHESIYRFIYSQMARKKDHSWRHYRPRAKWTRPTETQGGVPHPSSTCAAPWRYAPNPPLTPHSRTLRTIAKSDSTSVESVDGLSGAEGAALGSQGHG